MPVHPAPEYAEEVKFEAERFSAQACLLLKGFRVVLCHAIQIMDELESLTS